jgi:hypothetical protein
MAGLQTGLAHPSADLRYDYSRRMKIDGSLKGNRQDDRDEGDDVSGNYLLVIAELASGRCSLSPSTLLL